MENKSSVLRLDYGALRAELAPLVSALKDAETHQRLPELCKSLGMPPPDGVDGQSKRDRILQSFASVRDQDLPQVARKLMARGPLAAPVRNKIQDMLWEGESHPEVPKRFRRELAKALALDMICIDSARFDKHLDAFFILDNRTLTQSLRDAGGLREEIDRHVYRNPGDWTVEDLFNQLGAFEAPDGRFAKFLEGLASSDVLPDVVAQRAFVDCANIALKSCAAELREVDVDGGYPVFHLASLHAGARGRPKNLIFASPVKPDLRFRDALDNDVEVVSNADQVLIYDRSIGSDGLRWRELQDWWAEINSIADAREAKNSLYRRLRDSVPGSSPQQRNLFEAYHEVFGSAVPNLPALLPEVWLHWDPKTVSARGREALLRFRMDFLLLLPQHVRVVIEVDGRHHYADPKGIADPNRYAQMVQGDRDLKLAGYEVFRFGVSELDPIDKDAVKSFFEALFKKYNVPVA